MEKFIRSIKYLVRKPFKGCMAYEWQIGPFVFMLYYPRNDGWGCDHWAGKVWIDKAWNE
jgi:hypothetical protein